MGRLISLFQFSGRVGSAVASVGQDGKIHLRQYQPDVANPRTPAQMSNRAKLALASKVASMLGEVGRMALVANGMRPSERCQLNKRLLQYVKVNDDGSQSSFNYDFDLVDSPTYDVPLSLVVTNEADAFVARFKGAHDGDLIAKAIMLHDLITGQWRHASAMDANTTLSIAKSADESDDALEVFAYGIALRPLSDSKYLFSPSASGALLTNTNVFEITNTTKSNS
jgi:hypothetical protein